MAKAIRIHAHGGPEVLTYEDVDPGKPGPGQVLIRQAAIGLNFIDIYYRTGLYAAPNGLPLIPGGEGAGVVIGLGEGVAHVKMGDRVAYAVGLGAYAEERVIAADRLVLVPEDITDQQAAGMMLKGMTAEYLLMRTYPVKKGDTILYHAAAGGVGLLVGQWAKSLGATVIGTAGSADKIALAKTHGFDHVINYRDDGFRRRGEGHNRRKDVRRGLRFGRQRYVSWLAGLPQDAGHVRQLRPVIRPDPTLRHQYAGAERVALRDAADAVHVHRQARGSGGIGAGIVRRRVQRQSLRSRSTRPML